MNASLITAMNFALNAKKIDNNNKGLVKERINILAGKVDDWYNSSSEYEKQEAKDYGIVPQYVEDALYELNTKYNIQFDLSSGTWKTEFAQGGLIHTAQSFFNKKVTINDIFSF